MTAKVQLNKKKILERVTNDKFGTFVSLEWKRLIDPYTPRDTSALMGAIGQTVDIKPFSLDYKVSYAEKVYHGYNINFHRDKNPYATYEWDKKADQAGQKKKLYRILNAALNSGRF